jgi:patatin-like phospholipase/acyl hydrolase
MKQYILTTASFLFLFVVACNNADKEEKPKSENDIDAARNFIRSALDGKFNEAKSFLLADSSNSQYFDVYERNYQRTDPDTKRSYREATINIHNVKAVNDSTTVVIFSNSYKNDHDTLKVIKKNNQWLVDFKYLFNHDNDTLNIPPPIKHDTLK